MFHPKIAGNNPGSRVASNTPCLRDLYCSIRANLHNREGAIRVTGSIFPGSIRGLRYNMVGEANPIRNIE